MKIIDISLPVFSGMPVYSGTEPTTIEQVASASGKNFLSVIRMTSHAGTHIDAPAHAAPDAPTIDALPLDRFYGECRVLDLTTVEAQISVADLELQNIQAGERILLKTSNSARGFDSFYEDYVFLSPKGAEYLASRQVALVGIDSLSIKQKSNPDNTPHTALLSSYIPIVEGLNLKDAAPGNYTLCAFPLAFRGIDGAPARAVLITD